MRTSLVATPVAAVAASVLLGGCGLLASDTDEGGSREGASSADQLAFAYQARGEPGFIDQTLTITNSGTEAVAPDLDLVPLDADGAELDGVTVVTAYGSDEGGQVVPALTEVVDIVKFKGRAAADVADVRVEVASVVEVEGEVPPANDLRVLRFDLGGERGPTTTTLGTIALRNPYDAPVTVVVVGVQYAEIEGDEPQHFNKVSRLAGPVEIAPGEKFRAEVPTRYRTRFFGSVKAYLSSEAPADPAS